MPTKPRVNSKSTQIVFRAPNDLAEQLKAISASSGVSSSKVLTKLLRLAIATLPPDVAKKMKDELAAKRLMKAPRPWLE